jgi:hypothetical protein
MSTDQLYVQPAAQENRSLGMLSEQLRDEIASQADALDRGERDARTVLSALAGEGMLHADFVCGHLELADATGAWIGFGARGGRPATRSGALRTATTSASVTSTWKCWRRPGTPGIDQHPGPRVPAARPLRGAHRRLAVRVACPPPSSDGCSAVS